jgi:hypothetical protein
VTDRDFVAQATHTLSTARQGDTIVVAVLRPADSMVLHVAGLNPRHLTHLARDLLEQAEDALEWELGARDCNDQGDDPDEQLLGSVQDALWSLPASEGDEHDQ